ncbi:MAG: EthD family reductase [Jatrophihabitans sp.]|nr:MAG: EthD family reductase [Jatrophihabitans sp.]
MTVKLVVLYTRPADPEAFEKHYLDVHMPMAVQIPGVQRAETARFVDAPDGGEVGWYRCAELYFADADALTAAFGTEQGRAVAADFEAVAPPGSRLLVADIDA